MEKGEGTMRMRDEDERGEEKLMEIGGSTYSRT
jgi:hypothetical protein